MNLDTNNTQIDLFSQTMLAITLTILLILAACSDYNMVTCLIYIEPCIVSTLFRSMRCSMKERIIWLHLIALILSLMIFAVIMACRGTEYEGSWITCLLAVYPLYQYIYAGYMKYQLDKSKRE